jgi:hydrogenase-4 component E
MGILETTAGKVLSAYSVFLFLTILWQAAARRFSTNVLLFSLQSAIIAIQVAVIGYHEKLVEAYVIAALIVLLKVVGIPYAFFRLIEKLQAPREVKTSTSAAESVFIAVGIICLSYAAVRSYASGVQAPEDGLAASVALILTGAFLMVSRKKALMQMMGLLVLENGIFLAALTTTFGMPLVIEIGIFFDVLMGLLLMGLFVFRIRDTFDHLDVSKLRKLRG